MTAEVEIIGNVGSDKVMAGTSRKQDDIMTELLPVNSKRGEHPSGAREGQFGFTTSSLELERANHAPVSGLMQRLLRFK